MFRSLNLNANFIRVIILGLASTLMLFSSISFAKSKKIIVKSANEVHRFHFGKKATPTEIAGWDIDVRPDGTGLPEGEGTAEEGEDLFEEKCSSCHGSFGEGVKNWPRLAGGQGSLKDERPDKTVGSYWVYPTTLFDYIRRAMPFPAPQSLSADEVYSLAAYILNMNDLIEDDFVLNKANLPSIKMNNTRDNFIPDNRPDTHNKRCMRKCADPKKLVVTHLMGAAAADEGKTAKVEEEKVEETTADLSKFSATARAGKGIYALTCHVCHDIGIAGSPKLGDAEEWEKRLTKGKSLLYQHAIAGFEGDSGNMPPKGGNSALSDEQVKQAVDYMIESSLQ